MTVVNWIGPTVDPYGRVTIGYWGGYSIDVMPMIYNTRLVLTPEASPFGYDHGWCYPKGGAAILAAYTWDPETEAEPAGYTKRATPRVRQAGETAHP